MRRNGWFVLVGAVVTACTGGGPTAVTPGAPWHVAYWGDDALYPPVPWALPGLLPLWPAWEGPFPIVPESPAILPVSLPPPLALPKGIQPPGSLLTPFLPSLYGGLGYGTLGYGGLGYNLAPYPLSAYTAFPGTRAVVGEAVKTTVPETVGAARATVAGKVDLQATPGETAQKPDGATGGP